MTKRHFILSTLIHTAIILFLIYFPWSAKKTEKIDSVQIVGIEPYTPPPKDDAPKQGEKVDEKKEKEVKKEEIPVPEKKQVQKRKIIPKPKPKIKKIIPPPPKLKATLKNKLSSLKKDTEKEAEKTEKTDSDLKKNPQSGQDSDN